MLKSHFRDKGHSNTFILPNTKQNRFKYYGTNKGQRATSLTFSFFKLVTIESHFRDKDYSNTFILPDTKPNMFKYYGTNQGTTSDKSKLLISQTCKHRGQNINFASRVISFYRI